MQAIQMDQGFTSVLSLVRGSQPENTPGTLCGSCGVDSDRILSYEVTTAAETDFSIKKFTNFENLDKLGVQSSTEASYGVTSTCTPGFGVEKSLIVSH